MTKLRSLGRRPWTDADEIILQRDYVALGGVAVARTLGRSPTSVYQHAKLIGLVHQHRTTTDDAFLARLRALHAAGRSDAEIGAELRCERHTSARHRRAMGLGTNRLHPYQCARVAAKTREQCRAAGVATLADVRAVAFRDYAASLGWPADLAPREVHVLEALAARGPMTRPEIAEAVGLPWRGTRNSLKGRGPGGTLLSSLMARGLVVSLGRIARSGLGKSYNRTVYSLALTAERTVDRA